MGGGEKRGEKGGRRRGEEGWRCGREEGVDGRDWPRVLPTQTDTLMVMASAMTATTCKRRIVLRH